MHNEQATISAVRTFLELNASEHMPKSLRAIAESLSISEEEVGLAVNTLNRKYGNIIKIAGHGDNEGLKYYIYPNFETISG